MRYMVIENCGCYSVYTVDSSTPEEAKRMVEERKTDGKHHAGSPEVVEVLSEEGLPVWYSAAVLSP